ncbi:MAG: glycosyltransferase [Puniceicoccaceae bacterium]
MKDTHEKGNPTITARMLPDWRGGNPYQQLLADGIELSGIKVSFYSDYFRGLPVFRDFLKNKGSVDVYHLHWLANYIRFEDLPRKLFYSIKLLLDLYLVKACGIKIVWTIHNLLPHEAKYPGLEKWISRRVAAAADGLIVHSGSARDAVEEAYGIDSSRITVIPHGHYRSVYGELPDKSVSKNLLQLDEGKKIVLCFGLIRPYKGIEDLIEAWKRLPGDIKSGAMLLVVGKARDKAYLDTLELLKEDDSSIRLVEGFIPDNELVTYFSAADVVALPFRRILTSGSLLLALGYGKLIVGPRIPLLEEILGECPSHLFETDEEHGLSEAIRQALLDNDRDTDSIAARAEEFSWDRIGMRTRDLYLKVLGK